MKQISPKIVTYLYLIAAVIFLVLSTVALFSEIYDTNEFIREGSVCGIERDLRGRLDPTDPDKFILVVVGDGVKDETPSKTRPYSSNYAQGWDLYEGVALAMTKEPFTKISQYIDVVFVDDGGESKCAQLISQEIIKHPKVIGVIGHATSSTTKIALESYRKANIPVILPIATNPALTIGCGNCFRLPSNDDVQAKAISDFAINKLNGENIYLIWDESESAKEYSVYLKDQVIKFIGDRIRFKQPIAFAPMNYAHLLKSIPNNKTDVVIFCGYGSMAREFFNGLQFEYKLLGSEFQKPKVILSDGCKISDIKDVSKFGFDNSYLSFPSEKLRDSYKFQNFIPENPPRGMEKMKKEESYEIFGYDALTLFSLAFNKSLQDKNTSRKSLNENLKINYDDNALYYKYDFKDGENQDSRYFIYKLDDDSIARKYNKDELKKMFEFSSTPAAETIAKYGKINFQDETEHLDTLAALLKKEPTAEGWVVISFDRKADKATIDKRRYQILEYLIKKHEIDGNRILFYVSQFGEEDTQLLFVPAGSTQTLDGKFDLVKNDDLLKKLSPQKSEQNVVNRTRSTTSAESISNTKTDKR